MEKARCMRLQAGLLNVFWIDIVDAACYLMNQSPHTKLEDGISEEKWFGRKIGLNLRVFGCMTFVHINAGEQSKLDVRSQKIPTRKGYRTMGFLGEKDSHQ